MEEQTIQGYTVCRTRLCCLAKSDIFRSPCSAAPLLAIVFVSFDSFVSVRKTLEKKTKTFGPSEEIRISKNNLSFCAFILDWRSV